MKTLSVSKDESQKMAKLTKGYSFAFQVLGHFTWRHKGNYEEALPEVRLYLEDYVYDKIWSEMSAMDKKFAYGVAKISSGKAAEIKKFLRIENNEYTPYRNRLMKRGIIDGSQHGYVKFTLPMFEEYVESKYDGE